MPKQVVYPTPHDARDEDIDAIVRVAGLPPRACAWIRTRLPGIVGSLDVLYPAGLPTDTEQIREIEKLNLLLTRTAFALRSLNRATASTISEVTASICTGFSAEFLAKCYPNDRSLSEPLHPDEAARSAAASGEMESWSLSARHKFFETYGTRIVGGTLRRMSRDLNEHLKRDAVSRRAAGGRPTNTRRHDILVGLAALYDELGRRPATGPGPFSVFCESLLLATGLPADGVISALPKAVTYWRRHYGTVWNNLDDSD